MEKGRSQSKAEQERVKGLHAQMKKLERAISRKQQNVDSLNDKLRTLERLVREQMFLSAGWNTDEAEICKAILNFLEFGIPWLHLDLQSDGPYRALPRGPVRRVAGVESHEGALNPLFSAWKTERIDFPEGGVT